jgi:hypothetical protein
VEEAFSSASASSTTAAAAPASTASPPAGSPHAVAHAALFVAPDFDACSNWWPAANSAILHDAVVGMPHRSCRGCANWMPAGDIEDAVAAASNASHHEDSKNHEGKSLGCGNNWPKARNNCH